MDKHKTSRQLAFILMGGKGLNYLWGPHNIWDRILAPNRERGSARLWGQGWGIGASSAWDVHSHSERAGTRDGLERVDESQWTSQLLGGFATGARILLPWKFWEELAYQSDSVWTWSATLIGGSMWHSRPQAEQLILNDVRWCDEFFHGQNQI